MRRYTFTSVLLFGSVLLAGCEQTPVGVEQTGLTSSDPSASVTTGETLTHIRVTTPSARTVDVSVGGTVQMASTLFYSRGGFLPSAPYAQWRSTDPCVATVTNASPSWGQVRGVRAGSTRIITEAWGRADTVTVTVSGSGDLDPGCYSRQWVWNYDDVSFTGRAASSYSVAPGEKLTSVVLFAGPRPDYTISTGSKVTLRSELWYDKGGKLNGRGLVTFSSTDVSVATIDSKGVVTGRGPGRTRIIVRLGSAMADTVPLYVR